MKMGLFVANLVAFMLLFSPQIFHQKANSFQPKTFQFPNVDSLTEEKLGELLFNDPVLSLDSSIACASCHLKEFAFADTVAFSKGMNGSTGKRNAPSVMNTASRSFLFWDGRANS